MSNIREGTVNFARACGETAEEFPGALCARHPTRSPDFNNAFVLDERAFERSTLRSILRFFRETEAEWCFVVHPDLTASFGRAIKRIRIYQRRTMPAMVLRRRGPIPSPPANLDIRLVKTANGLREWTKTSALAFSMHDARAFEYMLTQRGREISQSTTYLGYASGRPVSTSAAFVSDGVMGIFGIGTLRDARGRGYGEAMTWATIREGRSKGCDIIYLEASPMEFPIYYRMGFRRAFDVEEWVVPRDAPDVE